MKKFKDFWGIAVVVIPVIIKYLDDKDKKDEGEK